jgi:hypothetical protein
MVASKDDNLRRADRWTGIATPAAVPDRQIFKAAQRTRWFGQLTVAFGGSSFSLRVNARCLGQLGPKLIK